MKILSGVQPTGTIHLGNYLGAIKRFAKLQDDGTALFMIADLHAMTTNPDPKEVSLSIMTTAAAMIASGVDTEKAKVFVQSGNPHHTELSWYLQCVARVGWMDRMTQFREKGGGPTPAILDKMIRDAREAIADQNIEAALGFLALYEHARQSAVWNSERASVGLYTYPVLQAADILLYKATHVPVGDDQKQHLNLARDIAKKFNHDIGDIFPLPQAIVVPDSARIMTLDTGLKKMSKSDPDDANRINLTDSNDVMAKKIKRATAHTNPIPHTVEELNSMPAVKNLISIYAALLDITVSRALEDLGGKGYGFFKPLLTEVLIDEIGRIRDSMERLLGDRRYLHTVLENGTSSALADSEPTIGEVRRLFRTF